MPLSGRSLWRHVPDRIPPKPPPEGRTRRQAPHPVQIKAAVPPCRKTGIRRIIPKSEMGQAEYPGRASLGANAGHPPANARAMPPCPSEAGTAAYAGDDDLFIFLRNGAARTYAAMSSRQSCRDGIRVGQAKGERLHVPGKVGIFTADNRFRFAAMRHHGNAGNAGTPHRHQRGCGTSGPAVRRSQQIDGLTRQIRHEPGFAWKASGSFKNVGNNAAYLIRDFRVIHSIPKMWFPSPKSPPSSVTTVPLTEDAEAESKNNTVSTASSMDQPTDRHPFFCALSPAPEIPHPARYPASSGARTGGDPPSGQLHGKAPVQGLASQLGGRIIPLPFSRALGGAG